MKNVWSLIVLSDGSLAGWEAEAAAGSDNDDDVANECAGAGAGKFDDDEDDADNDDDADDVDNESAGAGAGAGKVDSVEDCACDEVIEDVTRFVDVWGNPCCLLLLGLDCSYSSSSSLLCLLKDPKRNFDVKLFDGQLNLVTIATHFFN